MYIFILDYVVLWHFDKLLIQF